MRATKEKRKIFKKIIISMTQKIGVFGGKVSIGLIILNGGF
jgi:hypothetical protein